MITLDYFVEVLIFYCLGVITLPWIDYYFDKKASEK